MRRHLKTIILAVATATSAAYVVGFLGSVVKDFDGDLGYLCVFPRTTLAHYPGDSTILTNHVDEDQWRWRLYQSGDFYTGEVDRIALDIPSLFIAGPCFLILMFSLIKIGDISTKNSG